NRSAVRGESLISKGGESNRVIESDKPNPYSEFPAKGFCCLLRIWRQRACYPRVLFAIDAVPVVTKS
ncbi:MAG: hypothetical protein ACU83P_13455, partial [Gammaproteobacteria bacterium]